MSKGLCCAGQAAGDLGKPLVVNVTTKNGVTQRCGVCDVVPSCRNPQKAVFSFRFLSAQSCGLAGGKACTPTPSGIAQYTSQIPIAKAGTEADRYTVGVGNIFSPVAIPAGRKPYLLPNP